MEKCFPSRFVRVLDSVQLANTDFNYCYDQFPECILNGREWCLLIVTTIQPTYVKGYCVKRHSGHIHSLSWKKGLNGGSFFPQRNDNLIIYVIHGECFWVRVEPTGNERNEGRVSCVADGLALSEFLGY